MPGGGHGGGQARTRSPPGSSGRNRRLCLLELRSRRAPDTTRAAGAAMCTRPEPPPLLLTAAAAAAAAAACTRAVDALPLAADADGLEPTECLAGPPPAPDPGGRPPLPRGLVIVLCAAGGGLGGRGVRPRAWHASQNHSPCAQPPARGRHLPVYAHWEHLPGLHWMQTACQHPHRRRMAQITAGWRSPCPKTVITNTATFGPLGGLTS